VEAYWLGSGLLGRVTPSLMGESLDTRFRTRLRNDGWRWLSDKPNKGALPMHAFHVLDIFPKVGLIRSGSTDNVLGVMDSCRIRWGRVLERDGDFLVVSTVPLTMAGGKLELGPARVERIRGWQDGAGFVGDTCPGDVVAIHWDWACETLDARRLKSLQKWTRHELAIANQNDLIRRRRRMPFVEELEGLTAVSWGANRIDLFWVGADQSLMHRWFDGSTWSADESLGGRLASRPAVTVWAENQMEVFAILPDGQLWDRYWDGIAWHAWESLGGELSGDPAVSSWGPDRLDVFASGRDGRLWHRWWNGSEWVPWQFKEAAG